MKWLVQRKNGEKSTCNKSEIAHRKRIVLRIEKQIFAIFLKLLFLWPVYPLHHQRSYTIFSTKPFLRKKELFFKASHKLCLSFAYVRFFGTYFRIAGDKFELPARAVESR